MTFINRPLLIAISLFMLLAACNSISLKKADPATPVTNQSPPPAPAAEHKRAEHNYGSVWERMRAGYGLPQVSNNTVDAEIRFYTSKKKYFYGVMQQAEPYLYYVATEMQANGIPMEFALLPFIESSYNPSASSPGNQYVGMWQFGSATGRNLGLTQNSWYDGRKDVVASTDAVIRLLKKLYVRFDNDWLLAIAAYNAGDGAVQKAIDQNRRTGKSTDFWSLPLSKTTRGYIPKLIALSKIVADPNVYDFNLYPIADAPYFVKISVGSNISIADAAQKNSLDVGLLKKLNAGFKTGITDTSEPRHLLVPVDSAANFSLLLDSLPKHTLTQQTSAQEKTQSIYHTVKPGENLWSIAKTKKTSVEILARLNNISTKSALKVGQKLIVVNQENNNSATSIQTKDNQATTNQTTKSQPTTSHAKTSAHKEAQTLKYTIKPGDTLEKVAAKHNVSVQQLMRWNKIKQEKSIRPKQELIVLIEAQK